METLTNKKVKIRKPHRCWCCAKRHEVGEYLWYTSTVDGGQFFNAYWCQVGVDFMATEDQYDLEDGYDFGEIKHIIADRDYRPEEAKEGDLPF